MLNSRRLVSDCKLNSILKIIEQSLFHANSRLCRWNGIDLIVIRFDISLSVKVADANARLGGIRSWVLIGMPNKSIRSDAEGVLIDL